MKKKNIDKSKNLSENKLKNQCRTAEAALKHCLCEVFGNHKVLDKVLATYFRNNKKFGSRDRQFISESVFSVFRYFGIVTKLLDENELNAITSGESNYSALTLGKVIYFALLLNNNEFIAMNFWKSDFRKVQVDYMKNPITMANQIFSQLELDIEVNEHDIIPKQLVRFISKTVNTEALIEKLSERPPMWIRLQTNDSTQVFDEFRSLEFDFECHKNISTAVKLNLPKVNLYTLESFKKGGFEVQDLASQMIGLVANPKSGERWLDVCAGAGGKTLQLASLMNRKGTVIASDIRSYKLQDLKLRARRAGFPNIMTKEFDNNLFRGKNQGKYDGVLVDAPCSCSGVWRRNVDSRWTFNSDDLDEISKIQLEILENSSTAVKIEGVLIYATCSIFSKENEEVVAKFLEKHPEFKLVSFVNNLDGSVCESGMLQVDVSHEDCDSMFVARFMRK